MVMSDNQTVLTQQPAFLALQQLKKQASTVSLTQRFTSEPDRFNQFCASFEDSLQVDFSRQSWSIEVKQQLCELAHQVKLEQHIASLFKDNLLNHTEQRAVLHIALRLPNTAKLQLKGTDVVPHVHAELQRMQDFCEQVHSGAWRGFSGLPITDVVNIGIGGSDLGPAMVTEALASYQNTGLKVHFVSNMDGADLAKVLKPLNPACTLFIVSSKSFSTDETLTNATAAKAWLLAACERPAQVQQHFVAISTNTKAVAEFGINPQYMFEFWDWVGGRFSLWSAIGLPIALAIGFTHFKALLAGAHAMDNHLRDTPFEHNIPVLMALLSVWNCNILGFSSEGIFPYCEDLMRFPAFLQQLSMESNGKSVNRDGQETPYSTGPIVWGEVGTNGQHAFFQLLHQGNHIVPGDFIGFARSRYDYPEHHQKLLAHMLAQAEAMAFGKDYEQVARELAAEGLNAAEITKLAPYKVMEGNRPSTTILCDELTPYNLGALIAMYEHKTFVQGILWDINSFDQWGVELGKQLAAKLIDDLTDERETTAHDSATNGLISLIKKWT